MNNNNLFVPILTGLLPFMLSTILQAKNTIDTEITQQLFLRRKHREGFSSTFFYANKEEFKGVDSVEPDPSGFCKQVS